MNKRTALLLGASGLVGGHCLESLLKEDSYGKVVALGRRPLKISHPKLDSRAVDFDRPEAYAEFTKADDVFSCLGTTTRKTPSQAEYRRIDYEIPLAVAKAALERGARRLCLVSSAGADAGARFFYPRLKGELDDAAARLGFETVRIFRPSFLLGERGESRPAERLMLAAAPVTALFLQGSLRKYRAISAAVVGKAMVRAALGAVPGSAVLEYDAIHDLGL